MKSVIVFVFVLTFISFPQIHDICLPKCVDISLNNIVLQDTISSRIVLEAKDFILYQEKPPFEFSFLNRNKTQKLTCIIQPGDYLYSISAFKVEMNINDVNRSTIDSSKTDIVILNNILNFKSGKGIQLGLDSSNIINILGRPNKISKENDSVIYIYEINNPEYFPNKEIDNKNIIFLSYFNLPAYCGSYRFNNGKLEEFDFGFPYP